MQNEIYLDANATTAVLPAAAQAALQAMQTLFGNPSSTHSAGLRANHMMVEARAHAARVLGIGNGHLLFTSGATEAIQTAIFSALYALRKRQQLGQPVAGLLVYGATEHKAVPESLAHWNRCLGLELKLRVLPVNNEGRHDLNILRELAPEAALVCTMAANNETGVVSDLAAIGTVLRHGNGDALWLVDCVQALGKLPLNLDSAGMDYAAFSGHKLYAPKGIGLLYVRSQAPFTALMAGGGQEAGQRSGTENMAGIAALGCVLAALGDGHTFRSKNELAGFRDRLAQSLLESFDGLVFNTPFATALPTV
ncbi:MAG: aminotransferase class V-fold PLP-dependent enzyme, partial [Burkholderiaceae bacterium]